MSRGYKYTRAEMAIYWFDMYIRQDFDLTMQELMEIWGLSTKSAVSYRLNKMFDVGLVKRRKAGTTYVYRAKHGHEIDWIRFYDLYPGEKELERWQRTFMDAVEAGLIEEQGD